MCDKFEIIVAPGTYYESIDFKGKPITLRSSDGPEVTIIDGGGGGYVVGCGQSEDPDTVLDGFTITGGDSDTGGGMKIWYTSPTVKNCVFSANTATVNGGGMWIDHGSPTVTNCTFSGNSASTSGAGIFNYSASPTVNGCDFSGNDAGAAGGGMANSESSGPTLTNCTFSSNSAGYDAGGMHNQWSSPTLTNCTFSGNLSPWGAGGMDNWGDSDPTVTNCIFWGNSGSIGNYDQSQAVVTYSDIQYGYEGEGNIDADPLFVDSSNGDYHLSPDSPCIDAADNDALPPDTLDLDGDGDPTEPLPIDLDCRLRRADRADTPDTGNPGVPGPPVVDMGAYEYQCDGDLNGDGDIDGDEDVDLADLAALLSVYGTTCE